jgi:hypothetical protein
MKKFSLVSPLLAAVLTLSMSSAGFAHVGHGDEFQATGGIERVKVNAPTDKQLGIEVKAIAPEAVSGKAVLIPMTALVDVDGKQLVFVQYENFYEPVPVITKADATVTNTTANKSPANNTNANNTTASNSTEAEFPIMQASIAGGGALLVATGVIAFTATRGKGKKGDS